MNCKQDKIVFKRRLFCWKFKIKYKIKIELEYGIADLMKCAIRHSTFAEKKDLRLTLEISMIVPLANLTLEISVVILYNAIV